jgi:hypothetical protein
MPAFDGQRKLVERAAQPLEQQRTPRRVVAQQPHAAIAARQAQDGDLVRGRVAEAPLVRGLLP